MSWKKIGASSIFYVFSIQIRISIPVSVLVPQPTVSKVSNASFGQPQLLSKIATNRVKKVWRTPIQFLRSGGGFGPMEFQGSRGPEDTKKPKEKGVWNWRLNIFYEVAFGTYGSV